MLPSTLEIVRSALRADPSLSVAERTELLRRLKEGPTGPSPAAVVAADPRLVRRGEAARRLACSVRTVDRLARIGALRRRKLPGRVRGAGFLVSELDGLILAGTSFARN